MNSELNMSFRATILIPNLNPASYLQMMTVPQPQPFI